VADATPVDMAALFATLDRRLRAIEATARALRADLVLLQQTADATAALTRPRATRQGQFELTISRKTSYPTESELAALNPADFDLFLDLVYLRLGFRRGGRVTVRPLRETGLKRSELDVLRLLLERQGRPLTNLSIQDDDHDPLEVGTMRRIVCRLRQQLGGKGCGDRLIITDSKVYRSPGEGFGFVVPENVRTCLIKPLSEAMASLLDHQDEEEARERKR